MQKLDFNQEWRFWNDENPTEARSIQLPHDAMIHENRSADSSSGGHAYFPGGTYVYEKRFVPDQSWAKKVVILECEGIYKNASIYLNNRKLAFQPYGYTGFFVPLDELSFGEENVVKIVADNSELPNSRWYCGSGIYRPVWIYVCEPDGYRPESVKISTLSASPAKIRVEAPVDSYIEILDAGMSVAEAHGQCVELTIPNARLWSDETPSLYTCRLTHGEETISETFGICKIEWSNQGLFINGKNTLLRGGCVHHDNGILGAAEYAESAERRVRILKENGFNAIRSAHNPLSKAMLDACDKLGLYVMDETFDMWFSRKTKYDYGCDFREWWDRDTAAMVAKDHNHPSVIMYSIGNEVAEPATSEGLSAGKAMIDLIHRLDPSRPVTCGTNLMIMSRAAKGKGIYQDGEQKTGSPNEKSQNASLVFNTIATFLGPAMNQMGNSKSVDKLTTPFLDQLDIAGYNYASGRYPKEKKAHPNRVIVGSETFAQDIYKNWKMVEQYPYLIGDFMWTCWDHLGEAGIGAWSYDGSAPFDRPFPWLLSGAGVIDINGIPDASCKYAAVVWGRENGPVLAVRPISDEGKRVGKSVWRGTNAILSWSWRGCEGKKTTVEVYTKAPQVELLLNQKSLGKKKTKAYKALFQVPYSEGTLTAVAYDKLGQEQSRTELKSASGALSLSIEPEKASARRGEIVYVPINVVGENGKIESNADRKISVQVEGGELLAFGSAVPCTEESYISGQFKSYYGRSLAVIRVEATESVRITASDGKHCRVAVIAVNKSLSMEEKKWKAKN